MPTNETVNLTSPPLEEYGIRPGYQPRTGPPEYFVDVVGSTMVWQPDVYTATANAARALGARRIIDVGCGNAAKLVALRGDFDLVGIDYGENLAGCRARYPWGDWREHDLESHEPLPLDDDELGDAVLVSSDVIEHLIRPELLVRKLARALASARAVVLSTPERVQTWGPDHLGPPPNPAHVREWTLAELAGFLESEGLHHGDMMLTRSNDATDALATILGVLVPSEQDAEIIASATLLPVR